MAQQDGSLTISGICKKVERLSAGQPVRALLSLFQEDRELLLVAVEDEGFVGSVSRKTFLNMMSRPFAADVYVKKPIRGLLADLREVAVAMSPETEINAAVMELLALDPALQTDAFPLVELGNCVGAVAVSDLMLAVAEQQKRLLGELDRLSFRIREEVARGVKIQKELLPPSHDSFNGVTVAAGINTSSEICGDFFDYFPWGHGRVGLVIGDVSGHGVQAGMVTTAAKAGLHTLLSMGVDTPAGLLSGMNEGILATARQSLLMTCLIACIDVWRDTLTIANAGHNFPYLVRAGEKGPKMLETPVGFPLGFERGYRYQEESLPFAERDALFMYTDGIVECAGGDGEEFGYERFCDLLKEGIHSCPPDKLHPFLLAGASSFAGTCIFEDDVTTLFAVRAPADNG